MPLFGLFLLLAIPFGILTAFATGEWQYLVLAAGAAALLYWTWTA